MKKFVLNLLAQLVLSLALSKGKSAKVSVTKRFQFVCIFREECVKTDFTTTTPLAIATKLSSVIGLVNTGSFREAKQILKTIEVDAFLTTERLNKYIEMLDAADAIEYATDESYYYKA